MFAQTLSISRILVLTQIYVLLASCCRQSALAEYRYTTSRAVKHCCTQLPRLCTVQLQAWRLHSLFVNDVLPTPFFLLRSWPGISLGKSSRVAQRQFQVVFEFPSGVLAPPQQCCWHSPSSLSSVCGSRVWLLFWLISHLINKLYAFYF